MQPHRDDKILTSWNGLMIASFAKAYKVFDDIIYYEIARDAIGFIESHLVSVDKKIKVRYRNKESIGEGLLDDYAFYIYALLEMFEATQNSYYLKLALYYTPEMVDQFFDHEKGGFFMTPKNNDTLIYRPIEVFDGAIPSGNSVATYILITLSQLTDDPKLIAFSEKQLNFMGSNLEEAPLGRSFANLSFIKALLHTKEIVCITKNADEQKDLNTILRKKFQPNAQIFIITPENREALENLIPRMAKYQCINDKITFYVCENKSCQEPFNDFDLFEKYWND
jgi:uncharacterized protein YyaL (SSP411 family)